MLDGILGVFIFWVFELNVNFYFNVFIIIIGERCIENSIDFVKKMVVFIVIWIKFIKFIVYINKFFNWLIYKFLRLRGKWLFFE